MNIEEGIVSSVGEIFKVSKQISNPFSRYLKTLTSIKLRDDTDKVKNTLKKLESVVSSSKLSKRMKDRLINNMRQDSYDTIYNAGVLNGRQIQTIMQWPDDVYTAILRASTVK